MLDDEKRPDPEALLQSIRFDPDNASVGRLKIFLGMCPGVGKTFAMLQEARSRQKDGQQVVVGLVCTHGRAETQALIEGLDIVPPRKIRYRDTDLEEMDIDEVLRRRPQLVLVDELAHTNAPGSRHPKRYQDVLELLSAGIDVFTTLNVQHVESRRDDVRSVTGIVVSETVPDTVIDQAAEIELVDLPPQALRQRLMEGKVYIPDQARSAIDHFFKTENLSALREMSLRLTAEHVHKNLHSLMSARGIAGPFKSGERILVAVGATPYSESLIRMTRRWASMLNATWVTLYVERSSVSQSDKDAVAKNLTLARQLGAEVIHKTGEDLAASIIETAVQEHVTQIIIGKTVQSVWRRLFGIQSLSDRIVALSGNIDVHMVRISAGKTVVPQASSRRLIPSDFWRETAVAIGVMGLATVLCWLLENITAYQTLGLIYLLMIFLSGAFLSRTVTVILAIISAFAWNFLFIPPKYTFHLTKTHDTVLLAMFLVCALLMGHVTSKLRRQKKLEQRERFKSEAMYQLTRALVVSVNLREALTESTQQIDQLCRGQSQVILTDDRDQADFLHLYGTDLGLTEAQKSIVQWVCANKAAAGKFSDTLPEQELMYLPLTAQGKIRGVIIIRFEGVPSLDLEQRALLESFMALMTVMLEKESLLKVSKEARVQEDTRHLQSALLDNLSHELKTPLTVIAGSMDALYLYHSWPKEVMEILDESRHACLRLTSCVDAILDMTRLDTGHLRPNYEMQSIEEIISDAIKLFVISDQKERIKVTCLPSLPSVSVDFYMISQALKNVIHNALIYSPEHSPVDIRAAFTDESLRVSVTDDGPGVPAETLKKIFDKFYRHSDQHSGGLGLGLSIAKRFVEMNNGQIEAINHAPKGFSIIITFPVTQSLKL